MTASYDILLWGIYYYDLIFAGLPEPPKLGGEVWSGDFAMTPGGPFTTTVAMGRLGLRASWMCDFGDDPLSQLVLDAARREGLDAGLFQIHRRPVRRVSVVFSLPHDRGFLSYVDDVLQTSPVPQIERHRPRCVFLPVLTYGDACTEVFAAARRAGSLLFMDCQATGATLETPGVAAAVGAVDVFAPNETEALQLTGAATVEEAAARLAELAPLVVVKLGAEGVLARAGNRTLAPAIPVDVVDTTGAGDCFNAGFLYSYLQGAPLDVCLQSGNICGGLSTTAVGGLPAAPTAAQVEAYRASLRGRPLTR